MKYPFKESEARLSRFDEFTPEVEGEKLHFYCRGYVTCYGLNEDKFPVDKNNNPIEALSTTPWTPEEEEEIEELRKMYIRSMSCDPNNVWPWFDRP